MVDRLVGPFTHGQLDPHPHRPLRSMRLIAQVGQASTAARAWPRWCSDGSGLVTVTAPTRARSLPGPGGLGDTNIGLIVASSPTGTRSMPTIRSMIMFWNRCSGSSKQ
jgi:hypothetical protein